MKRLNNFIEMSNPQFLMKVTKSELSMMPLADLEDLIDKKDSTIKLLAVELKSLKEQNDLLSFKISEVFFLYS